MASTISAGTTAGTAIAIAGDTTGALALQTNGTTTAMTITTGQNVGIGTASPLGKLVVSNGSDNNFEVFMTGPAGGTASHLLSYNRAGSAYTDMHSSALNLIYNTNATERMRIDSAGKVTIATSGTNLYLSTVFGSESFSIDAGATRLTLANGASADVSASGSFSGYLMMNECTVTGQMAMYVAGSGTVNIFGQVGGAFTNSSGSGSYRFYHAGGGVFRLSNQSGSTGTFGIITFRTRNSG